MLVVREKGMDIFYIPGGRRNANETDEEVLKRELSEEIGSIPETMEFYKEYKSKSIKPGGIESDEIIRVRAYFCTIGGEPRPGEEIEEVMWLDKNTKVKLGNVMKLIIPELVKEGRL